MRKWNVVALLLAFGFIASPIVTAQSNDDLRREVEQLKRDLKTVMNQNQRVLADNAELRATTEDSSLEERVNALAESLDYAAGTTVNSVANPVTLSGEFRIRNGWTFDRNFNDDDDEGSFHDARFRVGMTFDFSRDVTTHFEMQANGLFHNDDVPSGSSDLSNIDLYQGWVLMRNIFGRKELSAKAGRQEIELGNGFIFSDNDYFSGQTFDGTHWMWSSDNFDLHFIFAKMAVTDNFSTVNHPYTPAGMNNGHDDDELYSLYFTLKTIENHTLDVFWVYMNDNNDGAASFGTAFPYVTTAGISATLPGGTSASVTDMYYHTVGLSLRGMFDVAAGLDYAINFAYQWGEVTGSVTPAGGSPISGDFDLEGLALEAEVGITFSADNNFRVFVRFLWSEGPDEDGILGYVPLFPERHSNEGYRARYGLMNIIPMWNVLSLQAGLHFDPNADWTLGATFLWAEADEEYGSGVDEYGIEIDVWAEYRYSAETTISAGIGVFFPEEATFTSGSGTNGGGLAGSDDDVAFLFYLQTRVVF